ncbi:MAG: hypothetical protein LUC98_01835 [Lachnospiraceae bacterium]|nr:hypothetical protein [Lachnospiraceae bacterium]
MLEAVKGLFKGKKEEPQKDERQQIQESVNIHRRGGEDIINELSQVQFYSTNDVISEEKLRTYQQLVNSFKTALENAPTSAVDTQEIDGVIVKMAALLKSSIAGGYENTADQICRMIGSSIREARAETKGISEEQVQQEMIIRKDKVRRLLTLAEMSCQVDALDQEIQKLDVEYEERKEEYKKAYAESEKNQKLHPEYIQELNNALVNRTPLTGGALILDTQKRRVIDLYNMVANIKRVKATSYQRKAQYQANIQTLELQIIETTGVQGEHLVRQMEEFQAAFQESLRKEQEEIGRLEEVTKGFDALMDAIFSSSEMLDRIIENDMKYQDIINHEREVEEGRRIAQEQQLQEELAQEQTAQLLNN